MFKTFPFVAQHDAMDCGPACLAMIAMKYGKTYPMQYLRENAYLTREGVSLTGLTEAASVMGFESKAARINTATLIVQQQLPCVLFWDKCHFVVLNQIKKKFSKRPIFKISDPSSGHINLPLHLFELSWLAGGNKGVALFLEPTSKFHESIPPLSERSRIKHLFKYLTPHRWDFVQLFLCMTLVSLFTLIFPFLTQALIDRGVLARDLNIVSIILLSQVVLFLGTTFTEIIRNWLILYIGARINISIISDFFKKIVRLPIRFFDTKFKGDFYQRILDHSRIQNFLTSQSITTFFSLLNFFIFFFALFHYNYKILISYVVMTIVAITWSRLFLKKREQLDYFRFRSNALNQESVNEMLSGIQEIKLNNFEEYKRTQWEDIQVKLFKVNLNVLRLDQAQLIGFDFINQFKNIIVTFIAAREVILGHITFGAMLAISYIIGQMNSPVNQLIAFFRSFQDAQLSLDRLLEVQKHKEEESEAQFSLSQACDDSQLSADNGIKIANLSFQFDGPRSPFVLKNINLFIPEGKTTAIVGGSGSGKTTLMKLLLQFYKPTTGEIFINHDNLKELSPRNWRENCGVVMQDGYIFSDTIYRNIATSDTSIDEKKMKDAIRIANISDFIESNALKGDTPIGAAGNGISGGQKQRILIARAVYKRPHYVLFDEATSALDTENERIIHDNLREFFSNKTVLIIAHRLSTVKNADQIIVLKNGEVSEVGDHYKLVKNRGTYYHLVKNQIELDYD